MAHYHQVITPEMKEFILNIKKKVVIGIVGGSDYPKMQEQMGGDDSKKLRLIFASVNFVISKSLRFQNSYQDVWLCFLWEWPRCL